jgi:hypothetical protein
MGIFDMLTGHVNAPEIASCQIWQVSAGVPICWQPDKHLKRESLIGQRDNNTADFIGKNVIEKCHNGSADKGHDCKYNREQDDAGEAKRFQAKQLVPRADHNAHDRKKYPVDQPDDNAEEGMDLRPRYNVDVLDDSHSRSPDESVGMTG